MSQLNDMRSSYNNDIKGFTLIELSIVLVIIGLIVGGVLVGRDLISAAYVRAQITQIEKYNSAVNTFRTKYGYIPGDMLYSAATQFGFTPGTGCVGDTISHRNGDGLLDGWPTSQVTQRNETLLFWADLTNAGMIDGSYPSSSYIFPNCTTGIITSVTSTGISGYVPPAKIGNGNFVYVYENSGSNWYGLSDTTVIDYQGILYSSPAIAVVQAYKMDAKVDDGVPNGGTVKAVYFNACGSNCNVTTSSPNTATAGGTTSSCYDTTTNTYSLTISGGANPNCALSFRFQ